MTTQFYLISMVIMALLGFLGVVIVYLAHRRGYHHLAERLDHMCELYDSESNHTRKLRRSLYQTRQEAVNMGYGYWTRPKEWRGHGEFVWIKPPPAEIV